MKKAQLKRENYSGKETLGTLRIFSETNLQIFTCKTLELPWMDNQNDISCIPKNSYPCRWTRSNRLSKLKGEDVFTYEILQVPNRLGIRIHSANFATQLLGCIALGSNFSDINNDGTDDVINSKATVENFNQIMKSEDFVLEIE